MRIARSDDVLSFKDPIIFETPQNYEAGIKLFAETALHLARQQPIKSIAIGVPGVLTEKKNGLFRAPHLEGWQCKDISGDLGTLLKAPIYIENDTALVGLGEATVGAGVGSRIIAYYTVSTGVGGVRIVNNRIDTTSVGFEPGHQVIFVNDTPHELEDIVSGTAVKATYGRNPRDIEDPVVWEHMARMFAYGLYNTIMHWSPDTIVLGGSMFKEVGISVDRVRAHVTRLMKNYPKIPEIKKATLGDIGGLYGGLSYLHDKN